MYIQKSVLFLPILLFAVSAFTPLAPTWVSTCRIPQFTSISSTRHFSSNGSNQEDVNGVSSGVVNVDKEPPSAVTTKLNATTDKIKDELLVLAERLNRGFQASSRDREQVKELIFRLAPFNPTREPASSYYEGATPKDESCTLSGKWTLVYTDAPDITSLDTSRNPFSTAQLGRIGQECSPPYIKNVIEWKRPEWARNLPLSGNENSRVLQKVVTSASASPEKPKIVNLKVAGLELDAGSSGVGSSTDVTSRIEKDGLIAGLLSVNPINLKGPLNPPFGQFEVLYLDEELRIIKTYQNYLAVNRRIKEGEEWF